MALHTAQSLDGGTGLQAVSQNGDTLRITPAAALEFDIENMAVDEVEADFRGADALGLEGVMLIHDVYSSRYKNNSESIIAQKKGNCNHRPDLQMLYRRNQAGWPKGMICTSSA